MGSGRSYTQEFKQQAVELANSLGCVKKAADQLGIPDVNIHCWKKKLNIQNLSKNPSTLSAEQEELRKLRKEVAELKQSNLILKTAAAFFSQDHLKKSLS